MARVYAEIGESYVNLIASGKLTNSGKGSLHPPFPLLLLPPPPLLINNLLLMPAFSCHCHPYDLQYLHASPHLLVSLPLLLKALPFPSPPSRPLSGSPESMMIMDSIIAVTSHPDFDIASTTFNFWHALATHLTPR